MFNALNMTRPGDGLSYINLTTPFRYLEILLEDLVLAKHLTALLTIQLNKVDILPFFTQIEAAKHIYLYDAKELVDLVVLLEKTVDYLGASNVQLPGTSRNYVSL
jgi:hypothetical protein